MDTTEANSIPSTQEPPSNPSPSTPSRRGRPIKYIGIPNFRKPRKQNTEATIRQVTGKSRVSRAYNLEFGKKRWYKVLLTSMSDTSATFDVQVYADSLRGLMLATVAEIGKLNRRNVSRHFSVTFIQRMEPQETHTESVPLLEGSALPATEPRITSTNPIDQELVL